MRTKRKSPLAVFETLVGISEIAGVKPNSGWTSEDEGKLSDLRFKRAKLEVQISELTDMLRSGQGRLAALRRDLDSLNEKWADLARRKYVQEAA